MTLPKLSTAPKNPLFDTELENDPEWRKNNLEADLRSTDWILKKVREDHSYAQKLYNALCSNIFVKNEILSLLKDEKWRCSWRYAGQIVMHMRQVGDYMDWYDPWQGGEGVVDDEIRKDLLKLGWAIRN